MGHQIADVTNTQVVVVMVPLPAQGHLNQLLHLSRLIASYNIPVHYVASATHNRQVRLRAHGGNHPLTAPKLINFHEFPAPSFATPPPNPNSSNKFPSQLLPSFNATIHLRDPVTKMLQELSTKHKRVVVIYDSLMAWVVQDIPSIPKTEPLCFQSLSAFSILSFRLQASGRSVPAEVLKDLPLMDTCFTPEFAEFSKIQRELGGSLDSGTLFNTCRFIEGPFIDLLGKEHFIKADRQWAIGPFNPLEISEDNNSNRPQKCLDWLDKRAPNSVIFVSFGTTTSLSDEQIEELAIGLEKSEQNFIWVLRDADKGDVFAGDDRKVQLPEGYEKRVKERGLIVRDWAPQLEILGHQSTGGFMSHCGWNSCMESITMGVPIAAWPMHSDQPFNAVLISKVLKIGTIVKEWTNREEIESSRTIEEAIRRVMGLREGEEMRRRAGELSSAVKRSVMEGGVTRREMDSFIAHITR